MTTSAKDRDRALAHSKPNEPPPPDVDMDIDDDVGMDDLGGTFGGLDASGNKVIVIHPGSQNLRIGLASDALPKTIPMVIARKWRFSESEEEDKEPKPRRTTFEDGSTPDPEQMFGQEVCTYRDSSLKYLTKHSLQLNIPRCVLS